MKIWYFQSPTPKENAHIIEMTIQVPVLSNKVYIVMFTIQQWLSTILVALLAYKKQNT